MGYLTPDVAPGSASCRALFVPDDENYLAIVRGALQELTFAYNWTKYGTLTPEEAAQSFEQMFDRFCLYTESCRVIGEIVTYAGSTSPNPNWLACDGSEIAQADYPDLYNVIGNTYGSAGTGNFILPDLRGMAPSGAGTGPGMTAVTLGQRYGAETHTLSESEMPAHTHTEGTVTPVAIPIGPLAPVPSGIPAIGVTGSAGGGQAHNIIGPRLGMSFFIVAKDDQS